MLYNNYFWGMDLIWWFVWIGLLIWIFALPFDLPGQRKKKDTPLDLLKRRFANGIITKEEYIEKRDIIENKTTKKPPIP